MSDAGEEPRRNNLADTHHGNDNGTTEQPVISDPRNSAVTLQQLTSGIDAAVQEQLKQHPRDDTSEPAVKPASSMKGNDAAINGDGHGQPMNALLFFHACSCSMFTWIAPC